MPKLPSASAIFHEAEYERELHKDAEQQLEALAQQYAGKGITARAHVGTANDVGMEILRIGEQEGADLIVIATHGMTGWHRLAFGSVAEKVVRLAACPVLVLRANPERESVFLGGQVERRRSHTVNARRAWKVSKGYEERRRRSSSANSTTPTAALATESSKAAA